MNRLLQSNIQIQKKKEKHNIVERKQTKKNI